jgi:hypothetical protein
MTTPDIPIPPQYRAALRGSAPPPAQFFVQYQAADEDDGSPDVLQVRYLFPQSDPLRERAVSNIAGAYLSLAAKSRDQLPDQLHAFALPRGGDEPIHSFAVRSEWAIAVVDGEWSKDEFFERLRAENPALEQS